MDVKIKRITISNTLITRIIAIASLLVAGAVAFVTIMRYYDEKSHDKAPPLTSEQVERILQLEQESSQHLQELQQTIFRGDTSVKRVKIVK